MCGLFGIYPKAGADALSLRILALFLGIGNINRGRHSWGVWGKQLPPLRKTGSLTDEDNLPDFRAFVFNNWNPEAGVWFAGHTRQATHGAKTVENTHPFTVGNLTLAHNGVVEVEDYGDKEHAVDSGRIAMSVVDNGWVDGLAKVSGSCGLIASIDDHLMLYRHSQTLHIVEQDWGWAISSEARVLQESCVLAGLSCPKPSEVPADTVWGPWDNVSEPAPAKKYVYTPPKYQYNGASTYRGQVWDGSEWGYEGGTDYNKDRRPYAQPIPLISDAEAKAKFLTPKTELESNAERINPKATVERACKVILINKGVGPKGPVVLSKNSAMREMLIDWAIECRTFSDDIFKLDPSTKVMTKYNTFLDLPVDWLKAQTEEKCTSLWISHYATTLQNVGVTPTEYMAEVNAVNSNLILDTKWRNCDWCQMYRDGATLYLKNFGCDTISVCPYCISDFSAQRRELDYRSNTPHGKSKVRGKR